MVDNFQDLVQKFTEDLYARIFPDSGVYQGGIITSSLVDTFDISTPLEGSNSLGKDVVFDPSLANQIPFENELGIDYFVGVQQMDLPSGVETNVRTGKFKYVFTTEAVGERADPDLVVDDADGTMTIRVNSVTESTVDHSGRTIRIFLKGTEDGGGVGPLSLITPFEDLVVQYDGVNNFVESVTGLGQLATAISVIASDYEIALLGPSVKRLTDLRLVDPVIFLGIITGGGAGNPPGLINQADRRRLSSGTAALGSQVLSMLETQGTIAHSDATIGQVSWSNNLYYRPLGVSGEIRLHNPAGCDGRRLGPDLHGRRSARADRPPGTAAIGR